MQVNYTMQMKSPSVAAVGLHKYKEKIRFLKKNMENTNTITIDEEALEDVKKIINEQTRSNADVKARIGKPKTIFLKLKNI
ncbi:unnamed protein product [Schistosoma margrebowiei]|uniref:Uncharacterized protein n=1 Tax=Schistosoma margrebowiei TaxID=48269 RepID=A0A183MAP4_9TREM|nr:unnamed protein product [Schistosoma margrebowiei]